MVAETLSITILGKAYQVSCETEERDQLLQAAAELDRRMRDIRQTDSIIGVERIAVMAALNLANEVLTQKQDTPVINQSRLDNIHQRLDAILP